MGSSTQVRFDRDQPPSPVVPRSSAAHTLAALAAPEASATAATTASTVACPDSSSCAAYSSAEALSVLMMCAHVAGAVCSVVGLRAKERYRFFGNELVRRKCHLQRAQHQRLYRKVCDSYGVWFAPP
jgi:hypothetical protein